jgi:hypothetical protein
MDPIFFFMSWDSWIARCKTQEVIDAGSSQLSLLLAGWQAGSLA